MKKGFLASDWFFGLVFSMLFFFLAFVVYAVLGLTSDILVRLVERKALTWQSTLHSR